MRAGLKSVPNAQVSSEALFESLGHAFVQVPRECAQGTVVFGNAPLV
jgi:hypothetical protein